MNKKGDFPTILLVLMALVLSAAALFIFAGFNNKFDTESKQNSDVASNLEFNYQYIQETAKLSAKKAILSSPQNTKQAFQQDIGQASILPGTENFFGKISRNEFEFKDNILKITEIKINSEEGLNKLTRTINVCQVFDSQGEFKNNC